MDQRLSITEWRPVTGSLPPTNAKDWDSEFDKYRSSPEFKRLNPHMTLSEFRSIYYMEWTHRLWGRFVGLSFVIPAVYFIARRKVSAPMALKIAGIGGLIGFQGVLGWWMVKSGLKDDLFAPGSHPRVSQYRLVAHLGTAFLCYSAMLWNGLSILRMHKLLGNLQSAENNLRRLRSPELRVFRRSVGALAVLVFITAMSGGLVAGLDAGLIYNEFPKMGLGWAPPKSELFSDFYSHTTDKSDVWWRNPLENPSLVQLDHRILATTTFTSVMALWAYSSFSPKLKKFLPVASRKGVHGVVGFAFLQVALGISTLIYLVPLPLASAHQAGSLALLSYVLILGSRTWLPNRRVSSLLARRFSAAGMASKKQAVLNLGIRTKMNTLKATPELVTAR
ncbi:Cytochrome c oxidase assembly protein cox15 [Mycoblastus sanguinarius]|nr:Cytochrome c oxidase assembly protein cox15 [Mycoblastus sanguinarius]